MSQDVNQSPNEMRKSAITEIMDILKDNPSIMKWVKNLIIYGIGFQIVIFLVVVFMMMNISGKMSDRHDKFKTMQKEFDRYTKNFEKKFDEEKKREKANLEKRVNDTRQRIDDIKGLTKNYSEFHGKAMDIMRDDRELGEIDFYTRLYKDPEKVKQLKEIREKRAQEKKEKEEVEAEKKKIDLAKEEYRLQGLEEELKEREDHSIDKPSETLKLPDILGDQDNQADEDD